MLIIENFGKETERSEKSVKIARQCEKFTCKAFTHCKNQLKSALATLDKEKFACIAKKSVNMIYTFLDNFRKKITKYSENLQLMCWHGDCNK